MIYRAIVQLDRTSDFDSDNRGSNPRGPATLMLCEPKREGRLNSRCTSRPPIAKASKEDETRKLHTLVLLRNSSIGRALLSESRC